MALRMYTRRILFIVAIVAFAGASWISILYARGYSFSFSNREFVRTGAITIDTNEQVSVYINDELVGTTSVLSNAFNRGRLVPNRYTVRLEREEYSSWSKSVIVQEGLVTDFPHVLVLDMSEERASRSRASIERAFASAEPQLTPAPSPTTSPTPSATPEPMTINLVHGVLSIEGQDIATGARGYQESPDEQKVVWWTRNEVWVMWLRDTDYQPFRIAGEKELITRLTTGVSRAAWWPGSDHVAVRTGTTYHVVELDNRGGTNIIEL